MKYVFSYQRLSFQIKDLEIRKFRDKYLLCVFSHNKFLICDKMPDWGDLGSQTGSRTAPSGGFPCDFNIIGRFMRRVRQWACTGARPIEK